MTDKELSKLKRGELLEMFLAQSKDMEKLKAELEDAKEALQERKIQIEQAGSIAEAALQLNGVFQTAQAAAEQYLENIEQLSGKQEQICAEHEKKCKKEMQQKVEETNRECEKLMQKTKQHCEEMEQQTRQKCEEKIKEAERLIKETWGTITERLGQQ